MIQKYQKYQKYQKQPKPFFGRQIKLIVIFAKQKEAPQHTQRPTMPYRSTKNTRTPYCRVCKDAGKPETFYRSHFTRDQETDRTICPTLLSQKCSHCDKPGHTKKYCGAYVAEQKARAKLEKQSRIWETDADGFTTQKSRKSKKHEPSAIAAIMVSGAYGVLDDDQTAAAEAKAAKKKRLSEAKEKAIAHYNLVVLPKKQVKQMKQWRMVTPILRKASLRLAAQTQQANAWGPSKKSTEPPPFLPHKADEQLDWWDSDDE